MTNALAHSIDRALKLKKHTPNRHVNKTMSKLVDSITKATNDEFSAITPRTQQDVRLLGSKTEYELELYWSDRIARARKPIAQLQKFPYVKNYKTLVEREVSLLSSTGLVLGKSHRVLIIGSGPLPLTYKEVSEQTGATVDLLDASKRAIEMSTAFCLSLGLTPLHIHSKGESFDSDQHYDVILLAALAGADDNEKQTIITNVAQFLKPNGRVIARSASGSRALLYPAIETSFHELHLIAEDHPTDEVINSILIYEKTPNEK